MIHLDMKAIKKAYPEVNWAVENVKGIKCLTGRRLHKGKMYGKAVAFPPSSLHSEVLGRPWEVAIPDFINQSIERIINGKRDKQQETQNYWNVLADGKKSRAVLQNEASEDLRSSDGTDITSGAVVKPGSKEISDAREEPQVPKTSRRGSSKADPRGKQVGFSSQEDERREEEYPRG